MDPYKHLPSSAYDTNYTTTNAGAPVWNDDQALTVGHRGPILLEDYHLIEKVGHFARERIPERIVHARGASAKGFFECTHDVTGLTCADFLRAPGDTTSVLPEGPESGSVTTEAVGAPSIPEKLVETGISVNTTSRQASSRQRSTPAWLKEFEH